MNIRNFLVLIGFYLAASSSALAQDELTCEDLDELGGSVVEVRDALVELGTINEGDEVDVALGDLIEQLIAVADYEGNEGLQDQISDLAEGWETMDGDLLLSGLNGTINSLGTLLSNDC